MGRVKEWAMEDQQCIVCAREFLPMDCSHAIDLGAPTCSQRCSDEYHQVMNAIADMQDEYCKECGCPKSRSQSA